MDCWTCRSISGEKRISPGPTIFEGEYWLVEHAYPVKLKGWLVIVLKRHAEALHEITGDEFAELANIQSKSTRILFEELHCQKEYISCYAEKEHFHHIHFHVFAKPHGLPDELSGGKSFTLINVSEAEALASEELKVFCELLKSKFISA